VISVRLCIDMVFVYVYNYYNTFKLRYHLSVSLKCSFHNDKKILKKRHLTVALKCLCIYSSYIRKEALTMKKKSVKLYKENVLEAFYQAVVDDTLDQLHIPHSDVFYVRAAVEAHYGRSFTLQHVEESMRAEGWTDGY
jgi:hypothetical protein